MFKLVALDLDGTILNSKHEIPNENKEAINKCIELGVKVVLISGREIESIKHYSDILGLDNYLTGYNGSLITDNYGNKVIVNSTLNPSFAKLLIKESYKSKKFIIVFLKDKIIVSDNYSKWYTNYLDYTTATPVVVDNILSFLDDNNKWDEINKICLSDDHKELVDFKEKIGREVNNEFTLLFSLPFFLEVYNIKASKGLALEKIANYYGVNIEDILAIGDGENDISMIKFAGLGIAMGNSNQNVKDYADYITLRNDQNGVSFALKKFIF